MKNAGYLFLFLSIILVSLTTRFVLVYIYYKNTKNLDNNSRNIIKDYYIYRMYNTFFSSIIFISIFLYLKYYI